MSVRLHVASFGVVLLALAAGLVAGVGSARDTSTGATSATALDGTGGTGGTGGSGGIAGTGGNDGTDAATGSPAQAAVPVMADDVLAESVPAVVAGDLDGREIAVLGVGDAAASIADQVSLDIASAGGRVAVRVALGEDWARSGAAGLRTGLARQIAAAGAQGKARGAGGGDPDADADALVGVLGAALLGVPEEPASAATRSTVWGVLTGAGLVSGALDPQARPEVFVVVVPAAVPADSSTGWISVLDGLATVAPLVLVAPGDAGPASAEVSLVRAVRAAAVGAAVSTVDHAGTGLGRVAVVRATADLREGVRGHYGSLHGAASGAPERG